MLVEDVRELLEVEVAHLEGMFGIICTFGDPIDLFQEQKDDAFILSGEVFEEHAFSDIAGIILRLLHLSDGHIIDTLSDPLVPIHPAIRVELHAAQLQVDVLVVGDGVAWEEVKIKGIDLEPVLVGDKGNAQLHDLVGFGNVLQLG